MRRQIRPSLAQAWERVSDPNRRHKAVPITKVSEVAAKAREAYDNGREHIQLTREFILDLSSYITGTVGLTDEGLEQMREAQLLLMQISASLGDLARGARPPFLAPVRKAGRPPATTEVLELNLDIVEAFRRAERLWAGEGLSVRDRQERLAAMVRQAGARDFTWRQVRSAVANLEVLHAGYGDPEFFLELAQLQDDERGRGDVEKALLQNVQDIAASRSLKKLKP